MLLNKACEPTAVFKILDDVHDLLFDAMSEELQKHGLLNEIMSLYLKETKVFSHACKTSMMNIKASCEASFNFDFKAIIKKDFVVDPHLYKLDQPETYVFKHNQNQINAINTFRSRSA